MINGRYVSIRLRLVAGLLQETQSNPLFKIIHFSQTKYK